MDSNERYVRFIGALSVVTGVALLGVSLDALVRGQVATAVVWGAAGGVFVVWGVWRRRSARR